MIVLVTEKCSIPFYYTAHNKTTFVLCLVQHTPSCSIQNTLFLGTLGLEAVQYVISSSVVCRSLSHPVTKWTVNFISAEKHVLQF